MGVATGMGADFDIVDEHVGLPVDSVKIQHQAFSFPSGRHCEFRAVPKGVISGEGPAYSGERGFHGERNEYLSVERAGLRAGFRGYGIIPKSVEGLPVRPYHLGTGILGMNVGRRDLLSPLCPDPVARRGPLLRKGAASHRHCGSQQCDESCFHY